MNAKKGKFSVKSCYNFLGQEKAKKFPTRAIWNAMGPTKRAFCI